jgi:hypothetical protein
MKDSSRSSIDQGGAKWGFWFDMWITTPPVGKEQHAHAALLSAYLSMLRPIAMLPLEEWIGQSLCNAEHKAGVP